MLTRMEVSMMGGGSTSSGHIKMTAKRGEQRRREGEVGGPGPKHRLSPLNGHEKMTATGGEWRRGAKGSRGPAPKHHHSPSSVHSK